MKLTLDTKLNPGVRLNYAKNSLADGAPSYIRKLLGVPGVTGVYHTGDFIALERHPKGEWTSILTEAESILGVSAGKETAEPSPSGYQTGDPETKFNPPGHQPEEPAYGEVTVRVQTFRGIPMQVRVQSGLEEKRAAMPERFLAAATEAGSASANLIMERRLEERGVRYGELSEVLDEVIRELEAVFSEEMLREATALAKQSDWAPFGDAASPPVPDSFLDDVSQALEHPDWRVRYAMLQRLKPGTDVLPHLIKALRDDHISVRRLAVVYTGEIKEADTTGLLVQALQDRSPVIRRTAGDSISDRGDPSAVPAMEAALSDPSKLVRWRAARFLYEVGEQGSLPALLQAKEDREFEIRLQIRLAVERISGGEEALGSVWQQMMRRNESGD
jgi:hypothetical protein